MTTTAHRHVTLAIHPVAAATSPIATIEATITTGANGTDGIVYLQIGGREFVLNHPGRNDFQPNSSSHFVLGGEPGPDTVAVPDRNDPARGLPLTIADLDIFPPYLRLEGSGAWDVAEVAVRVATATHLVDFGALPGTQRLTLGATSGQWLFLKRLRDQEVLTATYRATAVFRTGNADHPGPFQRDLTLALRFSPDRTSVDLVSFPAITLDPFDTPAGQDTLTITRTGGGTGTFTPATGALQLPITLHFDHSLALIGDSDVSFDLTTGIATSPGGDFALTGAPLDQTTGALHLVGASRFDGGFLGGTDCSVDITGTLAPLP